MSYDLPVPLLLLHLNTNREIVLSIRHQENSVPEELPHVSQHEDPEANRRLEGFGTVAGLVGWDFAFGRHKRRALFCVRGPKAPRERLRHRRTMSIM